jgi:glycosyltransferase involved in cell wall biosynthesis
MENKKKRILLIGPQLPPAGGVSIHLDRLLKSKNRNPAHLLAIFDIRKARLFYQGRSSGNLFSIIKYFLGAHIVHIHISHPVKAILALVSRLFGKIVLYTQHNPRELSWFSTKVVMRLSKTVVCVFNPEKMIDRGIVIPAYIPSNDDRALPFDLEELIKQHERVLVSSGSSAVKIVNETDMYGFDLLFAALIKLGNPYRILLVLTNTNDKIRERYRHESADLERRTGVKVFFSRGDLNFKELLCKSHAFIRATRSDGDSLSVREALQEGTPVVASDSASRPEGCRIFHSEDPIDLAAKLIEVLENPKRLVYQQEDFSERMFQLYNKT